MAYRRDLSLFKRGLNRWNEWRENNPEIRPDLAEIDRSGEDHSRFNLSLANLRLANLARADLSEVNLKEADLTNANLSEANLKFANLTGADLSGIDLNKANLENANFSGAYLNGANLENANLTQSSLRETNLSGINLNRTQLTGTNLSDIDFSQATLIGANLSRVDLSRADLYRADLSKTQLTQAKLIRTKLIRTKLIEAKLTKAKLNGADLIHADFTKADLTEANLSRVQALSANFQKAILTGACIEHWNINNETNFDNVICDYVYLKQNQKERRPHDPSKSFAPGEFAKLFQEAIETVDLIFSNGINWQAFLFSFQKLQIECNSDELAIQAIERKSSDSFVVRVEVPPDANKAEVEKYLKKEYEIQLKALEDKYRVELNARNNEIEIYKQQNANINEIVRILASKSINVYQKQSNSNMAGDRNIHMGEKGNYIERNEGDYVQGNKYMGEEKQTLAEAAAEIQGLLKQLEETYPTDSTANQMVVAAKAVEKIEGNPTLKQKAINALTEGGIAAFEKAIDNPAGAFIAGAVKGWKEAK